MTRTVIHGVRIGYWDVYIGAIPLKGIAHQIVAETH